jgi:hypothetical protein
MLSYHYQIFKVARGRYLLPVTTGIIIFRRKDPDALLHNLFYIYYLVCLLRARILL